jgi:hypothetical protein
LGTTILAPLPRAEEFEHAHFEVTKNMSWWAWRHCFRPSDR